MPVYEYLCTDCGPFTDLRPMAECDAPLQCPDCGVLAPRAFLTAPYFSCMSTERRLAHATNERSAHAPQRLGGRQGKARRRLRLLQRSVVESQDQARQERRQELSKLPSVDDFALKSGRLAVLGCG